MKSADEELKESHVELLSRFYKLFESVHRYFIDLNSYLQDLDDGRFIQTSLESVFLDMDGKQLLVRNYLSDLKHSRLFILSNHILDDSIVGYFSEKSSVAILTYS